MSTPPTSTPTSTSTSTPTGLAPVHRVEIRPAAVAGDPRGGTLKHELAQRGFAPGPIRTAKVYLIEAALDESQLSSVLHGLLADPVVETATVGATPCPAGATLIEIHPLPGVMDPAAQSVARAIETLTGEPATVSTGTRYEIEGLSVSETKTVAEKVLANPVVNSIHTEPFTPDSLPRGHHYELELRHIEIRELDDAALQTLSRDAHLFLSLEEMQAIQREYNELGREPTDIELETLAQTWSEHCVHKTLKSNIRYTPAPHADGTQADPIGWTNRPGHTLNPDGSVTIKNLLKSTVAAATHELIEDGVDWTLSVFVDNAGIIEFDDDLAVCVKVETHNHPSAIEPYGGAATGIGGCIRDIIGTGMAAKPIASTNVFCVGSPDMDTDEIPAGCLHPKRVLTEVVGGVRDYGNRMGIPTVNGAVWFDDRYVGNPLVYCGCIGVMPKHLISGDAIPGDRIIALGGRTGRDGIHGATFSSAELTDTHADEFSHAVQIGNAIEEKRVLDAILRARDFVPGEGSGTRNQASGKEENQKSTHKPKPLFTSITDCGAGGFSSAVGEMGEKIGADVHLDRAPLKYDGLSYTEIWISEAQERMVLAVPAANVPALQQICDEEHVELADLGEFGTDNADLILNFRSIEVGRLPMAFMHDGIPTPMREATWDTSKSTSCGTGVSPVSSSAPSTTPTTSQALLKLLAHPNIASKHFIIRQYDHEVQGNTVGKPLVGPQARGPGDAAIIEPAPGKHSSVGGRGLAIACGLATGLEADPYLMTLAAIDECVRNLVCVGADPTRIAILDNFCWPSCTKPENLGSLVRAAEGCYDGAMAYRTPFVSGKDSLNNQFTTDKDETIEIPPTLLITGIGIVPELDKAISMDAKAAGNVLVTVGPMDNALGGSHFERLFGIPNETNADAAFPLVNPTVGAHTARVVAKLISSGMVRSAHDVSDGGMLVAISEMLIAGTSPSNPIGFEFDVSPTELWDTGVCFSEAPHNYILEIEVNHSLDDPFAEFHRVCGDGVGWTVLGCLNSNGNLDLKNGESVPVESLTAAWLGTLDW